MEDRVTELETKVTYQDQIIEDLNQVVSEQRVQIDKLIYQFKKISEKEGSKDSGIVDISLEVPPPHY